MFKIVILFVFRKYIGFYFVVEKKNNKIMNFILVGVNVCGW